MARQHSLSNFTLPQCPNKSRSDGKAKANEERKVFERENNFSSPITSAVAGSSSRKIPTIGEKASDTRQQSVNRSNALRDAFLLLQWTVIKLICQRAVHDLPG